MSKLPYIIKPEITIDELIDLKRKNPEIDIRKHTPFGLTLEQYGHIYDVGGYRVIIKGDPDEIIRRLIEEAKRVERELKEKQKTFEEARISYLKQAIITLRHALQDETHAVGEYTNLIKQTSQLPAVQKILEEIRSDERRHFAHLINVTEGIDGELTKLESESSQRK